MKQKSHFFPQGYTRQTTISASKKSSTQETGFTWFFNNNAVMENIKEDIEHVIKYNTPIVIIGESGTGKEIIARHVYNTLLNYRELKFHPERCPFVALNMSGIPNDLCESELFGHERGAFTSARERQIGKFELANNGLLFLDEIQQCSLSTQAKLLRAIESRQFYRLGGKQAIESNCQLISASNIPLEQLVDNKEFRSDLYYRINVFPIFLPALRERLTELPHFIKHYQQKISNQLGLPEKKLSDEAIEYLFNYSWPGNFRELENNLIYASLKSEELIQLQHLPAYFIEQNKQHYKIS